MIKLKSYQTTTLLPNPDFDDSEGLMDEVIIKRTIDGARHTYVKTKNQRRKLLFAIKLTRLKALELRAFIQSYFYSEIELTDHLDQVWIGNIIVNPFEFTTASADVTTIQIDFEGVKQ